MSATRFFINKIGKIVLLYCVSSFPQKKDAKKQNRDW